MEWLESVVGVGAGEAHFPSIYRPNTSFGHEIWTVSFPRAGAESLSGIVPFRGHPSSRWQHLMSARSRSRVEVVSDDVDRLAWELQRMDARNLPRDTVFRERRLALSVLPYDWTSPRGESGVSLGLRRVCVYWGDER